MNYFTAGALTKTVTFLVSTLYCIAEVIHFFSLKCVILVYMLEIMCNTYVH